MAKRKESRKIKTPQSLRPRELAPEDLYHACNIEALDFKTTDDLPDLENVIGQPRAIRALELGSEVSSPGYNIFVVGLPDSGRTTLSKEYLQRKAADEPTPDDWCYVNNFENPYSPLALRLSAGRGVEFRKDMEGLVKRCQEGLPRQFQSEEFIRERERLIGGLKKQQEAEFIRLQEHVQKFSFIISRTATGFVLAPAVEGKPLPAEDIEHLSPDIRSKFQDLQQKLSGDVEKWLFQIRDMEREAAEKLMELSAQTASFLLNPWFQELTVKYESMEPVVLYINAVKEDMLDFFRHFKPDQPEGSEAGSNPPATNWAMRYQVNLLVDNSDLKGAPVVVENHPSYQNLVGRIEHELVMGATRTDFTMIRPGALHRANGGYLILPARDVLVNTYAWEGLKRVLREASVRIVELGHQVGLVSMVSLEPDPIPLRVKVLMVGTPMLYYLMRQYDEDFAKLFKVRAEFATLMERSPETESEYGLFVRSVVLANRLPPFDRSAVAKIIEHSTRMAEDQTKLTTRFGRIADLVCEAAYWAEKEKSQTVRRADVQRAIEESIYRSNLYEERLQEMIQNGTLIVDTTGSVVGQINALSVFMLGDYSFGRPSRLTAAAFPGRGGIIDIERQAKLGGAIHTKGVLIISGFLGSRYGRGGPLSVSASLTFEQSYDEIEGDSASAAELIALLSAISETPIRQDRAITGSINQRGQIQAIGGVNEKVEGFFAVCKARGLTGEQGVVIPRSNQRHLMLRAEVVQAVAEGRFHIWPISTLEEGIKLFTGLEAGECQQDGSYPQGTFNHAVMSRLAEFAALVKGAPAASQQPGNHDTEG